MAPKNTKKILWLSLFVFSPFLLSCSKNYKSPSDTITTVISTPLPSLNPVYNTDANTQHVNDLLQASLVKIGMDLVPEPQLAESFQHLNDTTLEIRIKKGCFFQNGRELVADDIEKSWLIYTNPNSKSPFAEHFKKIKKFEKINNYQFRLHTDKAEPSLLSNLTLLKIFPAEEYDEKKFQEYPIGAGSYRIVKFSDSEMILERFSNGCFVNPPSPKIKIKVVRDDLSKYLKLKNGEVDIVLNELNFRKLETIQADANSNLSVISDIGISYNYLGINLLDKKLQDIRVRRAIALSFDVPSLIRYKSRNLALIAKNLLPDVNYYANTKVLPIKRDLKEAKRLLNEAGYYNGENQKPPLKITLKTSSNSIVVENAKVLVAQALEAGIILDLRPYDWGIFYNDVKTKNTELFLMRWVGVTDPGIFYEIFHSGEISRNNRTSYINPMMDRLTEAAQTTLDKRKRKNLVGKIQEIAAQDLPYIGLWHNMNTAAFGKNIKNVTLYPSGSWETFLTLKKE